MVARAPLGPTGESVRQNIIRIRNGQGLTYVGLSEKLAAIGRPIPVLGLRRLERGERRVDVDDLVAFVEVLGVQIDDLLTGGCSACGDSPPVGFTCNACGAS